jgi:quercetin dioxygenase-like cupin family protein
MEIIYGDIQRHAGAVAHAHPAMEQATYVIEGEATAEIDGVPHHVQAGDLLFFPAGVFHDLQVISERIKLLVIYGPPYGEDPSKVIRRPA